MSVFFQEAKELHQIFIFAIKANVESMESTLSNQNLLMVWASASTLSIIFSLHIIAFFESCRWAPRMHVDKKMEPNSHCQLFCLLKHPLYGGRVNPKFGSWRTTSSSSLDWWTQLDELDSKSRPSEFEKFKVSFLTCTRHVSRCMIGFDLTTMKQAISDAFLGLYRCF